MSLRGSVSNSLTRRIPADVTRSFSNSYLPSAFVAYSQNSRRDVWIGDSGASCHMANDTSKMYCVRPPLPDQREVTTSDGTRLRVECIRSINVIFHEKSDEPMTLCDVSYVPDLKFNLFHFIRHSRHMLLFLMQLEHTPWRKILLSHTRRVDRTCERASLRPAL